MARWTPLLALVLAACGGEFNTPAQDATVGLKVQNALISSGGHELSVTRTRLVLDSIELVNASGGSEVVSGPLLVDAALDGKWVKVAETALPRGSYSQLKLNLRPLSSSSPADVAAAQAAGFTDLLDTQVPLSIDGRWDSMPFSQQPKGPSTRVVTFARPWQVKLGAPANLSLATESSAWFPREPTGEVRDPRDDDADDVLDDFANGLQGVADANRDGVEDP